MAALHDADRIDALGLERVDSLVDNEERWDRERNALSLIERALDDPRRR